MKCDTCIYARFVDASSNPDLARPYPEAWCAMDKWHGIDPNEEEPEQDPWADCDKYKANEKLHDKDAQDAPKEN